jgi:hypothetical protein
MKIGIRSLKGLKDGKVLTEADTKGDFDILNSQSREKIWRPAVYQSPEEKKPEVNHLQHP